MRMWPCNLCGKVFQSYKSVHWHRQSHSVVQPFVCRKDICHRAFTTVSKYQSHYRWHLNKRPHQCRKCWKKFLHLNHFHRHRCGFAAVQRCYHCHVCRKTFKEILSLSYHISKKHDSEIKPQNYKSFPKATVSKKVSCQDVRCKKADNKILLKITAGRSMTIISPSKTSSQEKKKKNKEKKSKQKHKNETQKNGIILSIKKGSGNMSSETKLKASKQALSKFNGLVNRVVESCSKGSNLKMKIKTLPEKSSLQFENDTLHRYSYPSSPANIKRSSKKVPASCSSDTESKTIGVSEHVAEPRVRNGIVIVKDKSGKLLAEQLQSAKAKRRENVFDSFSDVGMWKVMPSPRHESSLEALKLRLSPQKPFKLESGIDLPCEKTKYLDVGVSMKSQKMETFSEDSDVFESSPGLEKDSDTGMQNVNDSGIEILSSSSCNRSNGNSVRSVLLDDNSPTYFQTEDSLLSLDSPVTVTDLQLKTELHTVCTKCGGIIMETNNNAQSPRKCRCSISVVNSPSQAPSPIKSASNMPSQDIYTAPSSDTRFDNAEKTICDNEFKVEREKSNSETDDSDIMLIDGTHKPHEKLSEFDDVEIIRDVGNSDNRSQNDLKLRLKLKTRKTSVANNKKEVKVDNIKGESIVYTEMEAESVPFTCDQPLLPVVEPEPKCKESKDIVEANIVQSDVLVSLGTDSSGREVTPAVIHSDSDGDKCPIASHSQCSNENLQNSQNYSKDGEPCKKELKKKPLFKVKKKSLSGDNSAAHQHIAKLDNDTADCNKEIISNTNQLNNVRKKKPIFKKRSISGDSTSETCIKPDTSCISDSSENKICTNTDVIMTEHSEESKKPEKLDKINDLKSEDKTISSEDKTISSEDKTISTEDKTISSEDELMTKKPEKLNKANDLVSDISATIFHEDESIHSKDSNAVECKQPPRLTLQCHGNKHNFEDDDSLMQVPDLDNKTQSAGTNMKKICTSPLDLFQQQFLSFLSSNKLPSQDEKSNDQSADRKKKESVPETIGSKNKDEVPEKKAQKNVTKSDVVQEHVDEKLQKIDSVKKGISQPSKAALDKKEKLSLKKLKPASTENKTKSKAEKNENKSKVKKGKEAADESKLDNKVKKKKEIILQNDKNKTEVCDSNEKIVKENAKKVEPGPASPSKVEEKHDSFKFDFFLNSPNKISKTDHSHLETRTDSLSWLKIFSESIENKSTSIKEDRNSSEEITDFSADLAAINKKIDVSDDELNALDVDDVFKSTNLASLQPKDISDNIDSKNMVETKRPQKAKRSKGPLKRNRIISDSESELSDSSTKSTGVTKEKIIRNTDPDFNPFHDSDGDFDMGPSKVKEKERASKRVKHKRQFLDFISDSESGSEEVKGQAADEGQLAKSKHVKQPQKSCCPCCLGSSKKISSGYHPHHKYKLPKNSKQFVKSSLKLLELQAKIHQLFLSLFPDCAEIISNSKIGTEEFEMLIDEVLGSLEGKEISFESTGVDHVHGCMEGLYDCHSDQFYNSLYTMADHSTLGPGCLQSQSDFYNSYKVSNCTGNKDNKCCAQSECTRNKFTPECDNVFSTDSALKDLNHSSAFQPVHGPIEHPYNTLADTLPSSLSSDNLAQESSTSFRPIPTIDKHWNDTDCMSCEDPSDLGPLEGLDSDITITIDLNAAKVSLCRDPKNCLEKLHNRIARLVQCLLPKLKLKKVFFKNVDNLHFLLDLMITSNLPGFYMEEQSSDGEIETKLKHSSKRSENPDRKDLHSSDSFTNLMCKSVSRSNKKGDNPSKKSGKGSEERTPLLSKFQDMFEQEIKSHRESLKKDVFELDPIAEKGDQSSSLLKAKEVLTTISKIEKLNKAKQKLRPRRDHRLRKRSEAETRKLFVQEKILNNQYSSIVTVSHSSPKKTKRPVGRPRLKNRNTQSQKESFLSKLDLGLGKKETKTEDTKESVDSQPVNNEITEQKPETIETAVESNNETPPECDSNTSTLEKCESSTVDKKDESINNEEENEDLNDSPNDKKPNVEDKEDTTEQSTNNTPTTEQSTNNTRSEQTQDTDLPETVNNESSKETDITRTKTDTNKDDSKSSKANNDLSSTASNGISESSPEPKETSPSPSPEDSESRQKSAEKNIFELMQPS